MALTFISSRKGDLELSKVAKLLLIIITIVVIVVFFIALREKGILIADKVNDAGSIRDIFS